MALEHIFYLEVLYLELVGTFLDLWFINSNQHLECIYFI